LQGLRETPIVAQEVKAKGTAMIALLLLLAAAEPPAEMIAEPVVITATRAPAAATNSPQQVRTIEAAALRAAKAPDEALRAAPEFAAFRRSSSLVADPTSQGASLRGVGPSGVSRALVLEDGVPATDPFGGWIYWRALSRLATARVERVAGGGSALYGNSALGGVLQFVSVPIDDRMEALVEGGSFGTASAAALWSKRAGSVGLAADVDTLATGGYGIVARPGRIDHEASADHLRGGLRAEMQLSENTTIYLRGAGFAEDQNGGTSFTDARVKMGTASAGARLQRGDAVLDFRLFGRSEEFDQRRARIASDRGTEALAAVQHVPAQDVGVSATAAIPVATHILVVGIDGRAVHGASNETLIPATNPPPDATIVRRDAGGDQRLLGAFASDEWRILPAVRLSGTLRLDGVWNLHGSRTEEPARGFAAPAAFAARSNAQLSPRLGVVVRPVEPLTLRAAGYGAFRAPTLNELYRPFQVGAVRTDANEALEPETLRGVEAGFEVAQGPVSLRGTAFANLLDNPIANVTVAGTTNLQKRQNLGRARIRGIESGLRFEPRRGVSLDLQYAYVEPVVLAADAVRELVGKDLTQDPRHRVTAGIDALLFERLSLALQIRWTSGQYEDDRNTLRLPGNAVIDARISQALGERWEALLAVDNLFGREYLVARQPGLDLVGQPRFVRVGVAYHVH
jgi:iron complex outermembrane recepter protein